MGKGDFAEFRVDVEKQESVEESLAILDEKVKDVYGVLDTLAEEVGDKDFDMTWMGLAAKIMQRNRIEDEQCVALQERLTADGMRSCILKGQGVTSIYGEHLHGLRQPGDIDVWVQDKSIDELVEYVKKYGVRYKATAAHVECGLFKGTDVELHAVPAFMRCFWDDKRLREWFDENSIQITLASNLNVNTPTTEFNLVYMMVHMYHHVLFEGLGLRQLMDYYFVLNARNNDNVDDNLRKTLSSLGLIQFAKGMAWAIGYVFYNGSRLSPLTTYHSIEPNEKYGRLILEDVMAGGNFGHHNEKNNDLHGGTGVGRLLSGLKRNMKFFALGPWEVLCSPIWSTWHYFWSKKRGMK